MRHLLRAALVLALLAGPGCKSRHRDSRPGPTPPEASGAIAATLQRLLAAAAAKDPARLRAMVDGELALRLEGTEQHARARPIDQFPVAQRFLARLRDPAQVRLKGEELVTRLARDLVKQCAVLDPPEVRTPRWPTKQREGWELIHQTAALTGPVFAGYVRCRMGMNLEVRLAQRRGATAWKAVLVRALPFGAVRPVRPYLPSWD